jgi:hypothetical protein
MPVDVKNKFLNAGIAWDDSDSDSEINVAVLAEAFDADVVIPGDAADDDDVIPLTDTAGSLSLTDALKSKGGHVAEKKVRRGNRASKATTPSAAV